MTDQQDAMDGTFDGNAELARYFAVRPVPMAPHSCVAEWFRDFVCDYLNTDNQQRLAEYLGKPIATVGWLDYEALPDRAKRAFADWLEDRNLTGEWLYADPTGAPAWMHCDLVKMLPTSSWAVHFTDHGEAIKREGFRFGVDDLHDIALTREHSVFGTCTRIASDGPGYNFAYPARGALSTRTAANAVDGKGYGAQAVLFRTGGALVRHHGDRENQVVFWGPTARLKKSFILTPSGGGWVSDTGADADSIEALVRRLLGPRRATDLVQPPAPSQEATFAPGRWGT